MGRYGSPAPVIPPNFLRFPILQQILQFVLSILCKLLRYPGVHLVEIIETGDPPHSTPASRLPLFVVLRVVQDHDPPHPNQIVACLGRVLHQRFDPGVAFDDFRAWCYHCSVKLLSVGGDRLDSSLRKLENDCLTRNALATSGLCVSCIIIT